MSFVYSVVSISGAHMNKKNRVVARKHRKHRARLKTKLREQRARQKPAKPGKGRKTAAAGA